MKAAYRMIKCDLCGKTIEYRETIFEKNIKWFDRFTDEEIKPWKPQTLTVVFKTDQNDGSGCKPYLSNENLDVCPECLEKLLDLYPIFGYGAQGYNTFKFREDK